MCRICCTRHIHAPMPTIVYRININTYDIARIIAKRMRRAALLYNIIIVKRRHTIENNQWTQLVVVAVVVFFFNWTMRLRRTTVLLLFNCLFLRWFRMINCWASAYRSFSQWFGVWVLVIVWHEKWAWHIAYIVSSASTFYIETVKWFHCSIWLTVSRRVSF